MTLGAVLGKKEGLGDEIAEEVNELNRIISRNRVRDLVVVVQRNRGINERNNGNAQARGLENDGGLPVGVEDDEAVGGLGRGEAEALVAVAELLWAAAVGEEAAGAPEGRHGGRVATNLLRHQVDYVVEEWVRVDEHEAGVLAGQGRHEVGGAAEGDQGLVGVDDGDVVADSQCQMLRVVPHHSSPYVGVRAQQLLYQQRLQRRRHSTSTA